jgi:hypothetical protein
MILRKNKKGEREERSEGKEKHNYNKNARF